MAKYGTYNFATGSTQGYHWTGFNTLNMFGSVVRITEPIYARGISVYWGGYGDTAYAFHCIWRVSDAGLVVNSNTVSAPASSLVRGGQQWIDASIPETYLEPGDYFVGVWCNPNYRRVWSQWSGGVYNGYDYTAQDLNSPNVFRNWERSDPTGVVGAYIEGEPAARLSVKVGTNWQKGIPYVKVGSTWQKAKGIYVKVGSSWQRSK